MTKQQVKKRIEKLKAVISYHRYLYHVLDKQEISDSVLDSLKHELYKLEQQYPEFITSDSPTQRIGGTPLKKFKKNKHKTPMLSIEDIFSEKELKDWQNYLNKLSPNTKFEYFCELKIDGFAVSLVYKNKVFVQGSTRGDGKIGEDITQNLKTIESIPLKLKEMWGCPSSDRIGGVRTFPQLQSEKLEGEIEIRGEVYMTKQDFERFNKKRKEKGKEPYANPRNLAAGSIRQLNPKLAAERPLKFLAYDIITDLGQFKHSQEHQILSSLGFKVDSGRICRNLKHIINYWQDVEKKRNSLAFQIDGIVVQIDDNSIFKKLGVAGKSPRAIRAFKFSPKQSVSIILNVKFQVGRTGSITPVAILKPVEISGTTITKATLHNEDEIKRLGVKIGDTVIVERAGDVIPAIVKVLPELRSGKEREIEMPKFCPVCGTRLIRAEKEIISRCVNKNCFAIKKQRLEHFVSKKAFNIEGLGPKILDQLLKKGLISSPADIFELSENDLVHLDRFAEKSAKNLITAIKQSKKISLSNFIYGLGIRFTGEETAIALEQYFGSIDILKKASKQELEAIPDIGPKSSESIYVWFQQKNNQNLITDLIKTGIKIKSRAVRIKSQKLKQKIFVLSGSLETITREEAKKRIRMLGGEISESVSMKTDYLVLGKNPGSKYDKAKKIAVKIINEKQFLEIIK